MRRAKSATSSPARPAPSLGSSPGPGVPRIGERVGARFLEAVTQQLIVRAFQRDVARDARLWEQQPRPLGPSLAPDDEIRDYRVWARRFRGS